jgi:hypothetical protein
VALLFASLLFAACQSSGAAPAQSAPSNDPAELAAEFVRLFASGGLSQSAATTLMGEGASARREGAYWQIRRKDGQQEVVMRAADAGKSVDDAELRLDLNAGLMLSDLEKKFGPWKVVSESKTSSVSFRVAGSVPTVVFARLLTPTADANSPVVSLQLRRDSSP